MPCDKPISDSESCFHVKIFYALYDVVTTQMCEQFSDFLNVVVKFAALSPSHFEDAGSEEQVRHLGRTYQSDIDCDQLVAEYQNFQLPYKDWLDAEDDVPVKLTDLLIFTTANNLW